MQGEDGVELDALLPRLRCPNSKLSLVRKGDSVESSDGRFRYAILNGVVDLRVPPKRLQVDVPWVEIWDELDKLPLDPPQPLPSADLPHHLDAHLASVPGERGDGRWILEVGCGERQCESYFSRRGFRYVGSDVDVRGRGPHVLADAHNLPFVDGSFDFYTSMAVYEHLASPLLAALEARRVLAPGGTFFGTSAFVYGFHDRASFNHMTHAALLWTFRMSGFEVLRVWPDWHYTQSIPEMSFPGPEGSPWRASAKAGLTLLEWTYTRSSNLARRLVGKRPLDLAARGVHKAGSLSFAARCSGPGSGGERDR
jgi:SAM-dependent methyltransferase